MLKVAKEFSIIRFSLQTIHDSIREKPEDTYLVYFIDQVTQVIMETSLKFLTNYSLYVRLQNSAFKEKILNENPESIKAFSFYAFQRVINHCYQLDLLYSVKKEIIKIWIFNEIENQFQLVDPSVNKVYVRDK